MLHHKSGLHRGPKYWLVQYWLDYGEFPAPSRFKPSLAVPRSLLKRVQSEVSKELESEILIAAECH